MMVNKKFWGVVEGFYGKPYSFEERCNLIKFLSSLGLNTYIYGPKSDPFHRLKYYCLYPSKVMKEFEKLNTQARNCKIFFNYALSPGPEPDLKNIINKLTKMIDIGISHFSLFYDDIKIELNRVNAITQVKTANRFFNVLKKKFKNGMLFFCPTQYRGFEKTDYILTIARELDADIKIFWTGNRVVSKRITEKDIDRITEIIKRPPLIWDNIFANDYVPGVIWEFPYRGRAPEIIKKVSGIFINPMNQYFESKPLIYTAAKFFKDPFNYSPRKTWQKMKKFLR